MNRPPLGKDSPGLCCHRLVLPGAAGHTARCGRRSRPAAANVGRAPDDASPPAAGHLTPELRPPGSWWHGLAEGSRALCNALPRAAEPAAVPSAPPRQERQSLLRRRARGAAEPVATPAKCTPALGTALGGRPLRRDSQALGQALPRAGTHSPTNHVTCGRAGAKRCHARPGLRHGLAAVDRARDQTSPTDCERARTEAGPCQGRG